MHKTILAVGGCQEEVAEGGPGAAVHTLAVTAARRHTAGWGGEARGVQQGAGSVAPLQPAGSRVSQGGSSIWPCPGWGAGLCTPQMGEGGGSSVKDAPAHQS